MDKQIIILKQDTLKIEPEDILCFYIKEERFSEEDIKHLLEDLNKLFKKPNNKILVLPSDIDIKNYSKEQMITIFENYDKVKKELNLKNDKE